MSFIILNKNTSKPFLENKVAIITGASGDIGIAIAEALMDNGAILNLFYNSNEKRIMEFKEKYSDKEINSFKLDFLEKDWKEKINTYTKQIFDKYKKIDILINAAGIWYVSPFLHETEEMHEKVMRINYESARIFSKEVIKYMIGKKGIKHIINISSIGGVRGTAQQVSYSNSKAALINLTQALAEEFANYGINVNAISPTFVDTKGLNKYIKGEETKKYLAKNIPKYSLCNIKDVVNAVLGILMNDYLTGANILLHGGR